MGLCGGGARRGDGPLCPRWWARGDQPRADGRAGRGGGHKRLRSCHPESHPSASDTSLGIRPGPLQQLHPLQQNQPPASEPSLCAGSVPSHQLHPAALDPSSCLGSILLPRIHPPSSDPVPDQHSLSLPTPPSSGWGTSSGDQLRGSAPFPPTSLSHGAPLHPCTELGQFSCPCVSGSSTLWPASSEGMGCRRAVPCRMRVPVWPHVPLGAEHPGGAPSRRPSLLAPVLAVSQPTPAELPKHRANGDKPGERLIFASVYFPPSKSTSQNSGGRRGGGGKDGETHRVSRGMLPPPAPALYLFLPFPAPHFMSAP